jgi:BMFP domain-containing protein YqiC
MQTTGKLFDDMAKVASGAMGTLGGMREEAEAAFRQRLERLLADMDVVPREEFDAMAEVARRAREEQEKLSETVARLEARIAALESGGTPGAGKPAAKAAPAAKKARTRKASAKAAPKATVKAKTSAKKPG